MKTLQDLTIVWGDEDNWEFGEDWDSCVPVTPSPVGVTQLRFPGGVKRLFPANTLERGALVTRT